MDPREVEIEATADANQELNEPKKDGASAEQPTKKKWSCCCKACLCFCCCFCTVALSLGVGAGVIYSAYEEPSVDVTNTTLKNIRVKRDALNVPNEVQASFDITVRVDNPSRPPIGVTVKDVKAQAYSLDKNSSDQIGRPALLAYANIDGTTKIEPESVTDVILTATISSETGKNPDVVSRFIRDCNSMTGDRKTKLRVHIEQVIVDVFGTDVSLGGIDVDSEVTCEISASSPAQPQAPTEPQSSRPIQAQEPTEPQSSQTQPQSLQLPTSQPR